MKFDSLFEPFSIGSMTLRNRLMVPAMGTNFANPDGTLSDRFIAYYEERARGGYGLVTTEVVAISPRGKAGPCEPGIYDDSFVPGFARLAERLHAHGACLSIQLHHAGRQTVSHFLNGQKPQAPSPLPCPVCRETPEEIPTCEVYLLVEDFVKAARRARDAGADAVEIHGAHGYLISEFMSSYANARSDEFGGTLENRMRFPLLIVKGIRNALGDDFPIIFRISAEENVPSGRTFPETRAMVRMLEDAGISAIHISTGTYGDSSGLWGSSAIPLANLSDFAKEIKKTVSIPVITVGRINDPYIADDLLRSGVADIIATGRQSMADPHFPNKIRTGRTSEICPCIACHEECASKILAGQKTGCAINPFCGRESELISNPAKIQRKILVAGAGPAGMMAAWLAASRGHLVDLYEKDERPGGQFRIASYPPTKSALGNVIRWLSVMCEKHGVNLHYGYAVTAELLQRQKPDVVILATGGVPQLAPIKGIELPELKQAIDVLAGKISTGQKILVAGGGMVGAETADYLCFHGKDVTVVELKDAIAADMPMEPRAKLLRRLNEGNVQLLTGTAIEEFFADGVRIRQDGQIKELKGFDTVVVALGARPHNPLEMEAARIAAQVFVIGDAKKAGKISTAMRNAAETALNL